MASIPITVEVEPVGIGSRVGVSVAAGIARSAPADLEALFDALVDALAEHRLRPADVVRNRLLAPTRAVRDAASAVRFRRLAGPARCATSSYIDDGRFPGGDGVGIETLALARAGDGKVAVEREPPEAPCRYVATADLVFLSGLTSTDPELHPQLDEIRKRLADTLAHAEARLGGAVRPTDAAAWIHRSVGLDELPDLAARVGLAGLPIEIRRCNGFSKPGKLIELEVDAVVDITGRA